MRSHAFLISLAILILISLFCGITPEEYEGEPNIYAILTGDSLQATVMVGLTASIDDTMKVDTISDEPDEDGWIDDWPWIRFPWNGVSGAEVRLRQGGHRYVLLEDPDSAGYYSSDSIQFSARKTWELEVTYSTGEEISARTTIPGGFEITSPLVDTLAETDTLTWTPSIGAAGYSIRARIWITTEDMDTVIVLTYPLLVSSDTISLPVTEIFYPWGDSAVIFVSALDINAYDYRYYVENRWDPNVRVEDFMHIEGAWGVFGSQVVERSRIYICPPLDTLPLEERH